MAAEGICKNCWTPIPRFSDGQSFNSIINIRTLYKSYLSHFQNSFAIQFMPTKDAGKPQPNHSVKKNYKMTQLFQMLNLKSTPAPASSKFFLKPNIYELDVLAIKLILSPPHQHRRQYVQNLERGKLQQ